jgi:hypothetical protein
MNAALTALPPALQNWTPWLSWFDTELAELLGDLVLRMAALIGPTYAARRVGGEEPDGLGDIRTRGSYERLISTEWALAEDVPEEFLRRAASFEHLFFTPRLQTPVSERSIVAIFDTGPLQLGAAKLVHVAAWILLSRRAQEMGGQLRWGQMQTPGVLRDASGDSALKALLDARTYKTVAPACAMDWLTHLEQVQGRQAPGRSPQELEIWWIGFGQVNPPSSAPAWHGLQVRPDMLGDHLQVALNGKRGTRSTLLPVPPERQGALVVRGEFRAPVTRPTRLDGSYRIGLTHAPLINFQSTHIAVREVDGHSLLVFPIPKANQGGTAKPRRHAWSSKNSVVATLLDGRQPGALSISGDSLHFWQLPGFAVRDRPQPEVFDATVAARMLPMALLEDTFLRRLCVIDRAGRVVAWDARRTDTAQKVQSPPPTPSIDTNTAAQVLTTRALGLVQISAAGLHVVTESADGLAVQLVSTQTNGRFARILLSAPLESADQAWLAYGTPRRQVPVLRGVALRHAASPERWTILPREGLAHSAQRPAPRAVEVVLSPALRAVGLGVDAKGDLQLIVMAADRLRLMLHGMDGRVSLLAQAKSPIEKCTVDALRGYVVFITRERELVVMSLLEQKAVLLVRSEAGSGT